MNMLVICNILLLILSALIIISSFVQKDIFTKILFLNTSTSIFSLFICFFGTFQVNSSYIDIALIYFLLSVVATSAYMKYFFQKHKQEISDEL